MTAGEYLPQIEELGFTLVDTETIEGIVHSVFEAPDGTRFLYPGARGYAWETPMIPHRKLPELLAKAKAHLSGEGQSG